MRRVASRRFVGGGSAARPPALRFGVTLPRSFLLGVYAFVCARACVATVPSSPEVADEADDAEEADSDEAEDADEAVTSSARFLRNSEGTP
jgi:hypothetical protein